MTVYVRGVAPCAGTCGRMLRSSHQTIAQAPGTLKREIGGMCRTCARQSVTDKPLPAEVPPYALDADESLRAFIQARRSRGIKPQGASV